MKKFFRLRYASGAENQSQIKRERTAFAVAAANLAAHHASPTLASDFVLLRQIHDFLNFMVGFTRISPDK
jgi:hypothetical protein